MRIWPGQVETQVRAAEVRPVAPDEASIAQAIRLGDPAAEAGLVRRYRERVLVMATARTGDPDIAADLAHEVILAVILALRNGKLRNVDSLSAFVCGAARNLINNYLRTRSLRKEEPLPEELPREAPTAYAYDTERRQLVSRAIQELQPNDRQILYLTLVDDLKPAQIAARLELSSDVVRTRKSRALRRIKEHIRQSVTNSGVAATGEGGDR